MRKAIVTIGTFDGVHRGHRWLIESAAAEARRRGLASSVLALERPVRPVIGVLTTPAEKQALLAGLPVDEVCILPVTEELTAMRPEDFFETVIVREMHAACVMVGEHFAFGRRREGTLRWLARACRGAGLELRAMRRRTEGGDPISSSRVRALLSAGRLSAANHLLGRPYAAEGMQESGRGIARTLGFPTINLRLPSDKLLPPGVFAAVVEDRGRLRPAVVNIGSRPTFVHDGPVVLEAHLPGFSGRWPPGMPVRLHFIRHIRAERTFTGPDRLAAQIGRDVTAAMSFLNGLHRL